MRAIRAKNTAPEMLVRRLVHTMGYRFRLHRATLPGKPDLVFPSRKRVIFVNGCFWHGHTCKAGRRVPIQNRPYWMAKIARNKTRDRASRKMLKKLGWDSLILWECQLKGTARVRRRVERFLSEQ